MNNCRFGNVQPAFLSEFSNSYGSVAERREFPTLLQLRKILLRTVNWRCFLSLSNARKYSVLRRLKVILLTFAKYAVLDWFFCFRGTLHSVFCQFFNCFLTGITNLNITAQCRPQTRDPNMISPTFPKLILRNGNYSQRICRIML